MNRITLLLVLLTALIAVGCSNIQVQMELAEQNEANVTQAQEDIKGMADLLDKAAAGDATWKDEWDDPAETDPVLKGAIRASIELNAEASVTSAKEIVSVAKHGD